jgi:negative regulator of flagellin synthesis FlgM
MSNKINGIDSKPVPVSGGTPVGRVKPAPGDVAQAGTPRNDGVRITDAARQLAVLEKAIADVPEVNDSRVAEISSAIEQGRYQIEPQKIAQRLLRMEYELAKASGKEK